ncbi:MAG TPA: hypothetical protein PK384_14540, partial [Candidatus Latescibacteria bacterium]|nr:hypothetical protein [Candidatus Latescibacterota bacterium]
GPPLRVTLAERLMIVSKHVTLLLSYTLARLSRAFTKVVRRFCRQVGGGVKRPDHSSRSHP